MILVVEETIPKTWWEKRDVIYFQEVCMCSWNSVLELQQVTTVGMFQLPLCGV